VLAMVLSRVVKPKNQRVKRALVKRESKLIENDKTALFIKGGHTSEKITQALKDLYSLKKPLATLFKKKNITRPFEDETSVEFFAQKTDASLFMFGSNSKKRPDNLVIGRLYDYHLLDMVELGIDKFKTMSEFGASSCAVGTKPCLMFSGLPFEEDKDHKRLKSMLIDFFRGPVVKSVRLQGIEHVLTFTAAEGKIYMRSYRILLKKSGSRTPRVELDEMGPSLDLVLRRTKIASDDLFKRACRTPKATKTKKVKNKSRNALGTEHGRIHMTKQDLGQLQTRKLKGLKKRRGEEEDQPQETDITDPTSPPSSKISKSDNSVFPKGFGNRMKMETD